MAYNLARLKRMKGNRRKVLRFRPIKPALGLRRDLELIGLEMVEFVYGFAPQLLRAIPEPGVVTDAPADDIERIVSFILTQTNAVMARLQLRVRGWAQRSEERHREAWTAAVLSGAGVNVDTVLDPDVPDRTVGTSVLRATNLIRDIGDEGRKRIADLVIAAVAQRRPPREVAKDIMAGEEMSRRRAINIAADQANKLNAALDRARQREAGVNHFTWRHSGKVHARPEHLERDGNVYAWDDNDIPENDYPGEPPFCGCVAQATLIDEEAPDSSDELDELDLEDTR